jgi:hypothetical protein
MKGWMSVGISTLWTIGALSVVALSSEANAHSASDAYLTLTADAIQGPGKSTLQGQWDVALRDLDFVLKLDDDGDGRLTWGEVRHHEAAIEQYVYSHLTFDGGPGNACRIKPGRPLIDAHADGSYAALFFEAVCARPTHKIAVHYTLFFAIDPSHRAIVVMHDGDTVATAVLSPQNATIELNR